MKTSGQFLKCILLGGLLLTALPAFSDEEKSSTSPVTVSVYTGIRGANLGGNEDEIRGLGEIGLELMHGNVSTNFGLSSGWCNGVCTCGSAGFKLYSAGVDSKDKIFCGLDYMGGYNWHDDVVHTLAVTSGYKHTYSNGYFISPHVGVERSNNSESWGSLRFGMNTGYQF